MLMGEEPGNGGFIRKPVPLRCLILDKTFPVSHLGIKNLMELHGCLPQRTISIRWCTRGTKGVGFGRCFAGKAGTMCLPVHCPGA
jgi:hypothetical protein